MNVHVQYLREKYGEDFTMKFTMLKIPYTKYYSNSCKSIQRDRVSLNKKDVNQKAKCPLKRNLIKSVLKNPLKALHRRSRFKASRFKFQVSEKELQCMNGNIL
jgi:hypothetical protein